MASIKIGSLNCRGLAEDVKRKDLFLRCKEKYDITILVDTHCKKENENKWRQEWGYKGFFCSHTGNSRGIAILFNNTFKFSVHNEIYDRKNNFIILDITIQECRMTLVAIYGPNEDSPNFYSDIQNRVIEIQNSTIVMVGDWNVVQDYDKDTYNYRSKNNLNAHKKIQEMKEVLDLVDIWRALNPDKRRYTWRGPNLKQSRLDYFLISSDFESLVKNADIDSSYRSDHSPVNLELQFYNQTKGRGTWKFNNSLLHDKDYVLAIKKCISDTINQYSLPVIEGDDISFSINPHILWEIMKCEIRGKTISYSSHLKKKTEIEITELEKKLENLQHRYEECPNLQLANEIQLTEQNLKIEREKKISGIMARAKARWLAEGERCTNYFCNLEKRHYNDKLISKLINDNNEEISDQFEILDIQKNFYEKLYSSSHPVFDQEHEDLFFNKDNPFINILSEEDKLFSEGELKRSECLEALKNMKNRKSPGIDGFTTEFFKFFWNDLNTYLIKSYNYSFETGSFSSSQSQGLITCIPKEGKSKLFLKNWRPITLLNVDTKIASSALANRIKPLLQKIISETQKGFLKGRYIGECTRLLFDLIEKVEEDDIPALLLLLDFEKAFDTLEWSFIDKTLEFFGFGPDLCNWVKSLYSNSKSCITNNGHCSPFFDIHRGVRQGDPLSPYLFILALELMSACIKNDPGINGIVIDNSEYLISQYADDSSLLLDGNSRSLERSLYILHKFEECAGLKINIDKTEAIWIGSKMHSNEKLLPHLNLNWNTTGKFKSLGISFNLFAEDKTSINFEEKILKIKSLLNSWIYRELTYLGKITVIKSLALSILIQSLTVLPIHHRVY